MLRNDPGIPYILICPAGVGDVELNNRLVEEGENGPFADLCLTHTATCKEATHYLETVKEQQLPGDDPWYYKPSVMRGYYGSLLEAYDRLKREQSPLARYNAVVLLDNHVTLCDVIEADNYTSGTVALILPPLLETYERCQKQGQIKYQFNDLATIYDDFAKFADFYHVQVFTSFEAALKGIQTIEEERRK